MLQSIMQQRLADMPQVQLLHRICLQAESCNLTHVATVAQLARSPRHAYNVKSSNKAVHWGCLSVAVWLQPYIQASA